MVPVLSARTRTPRQIFIVTTFKSESKHGGKWSWIRSAPLAMTTVACCLSTVISHSEVSLGRPDTKLCAIGMVYHEHKKQALKALNIPEIYIILYVYTAVQRLYSRQMTPRCQFPASASDWSKSCCTREDTKKIK